MNNLTEYCYNTENALKIVVVNLLIVKLENADIYSTKKRRTRRWVNQILLTDIKTLISNNSIKGLLGIIIP